MAKLLTSEPSSLTRLSNTLFGMRPDRRFVWLLAALGPIFALGSAWAINYATRIGEDGVTLVNFVFLVNLCYILLLIGLTGRLIARAFVERRQRSAGSRLHLRLIGLFSLLAVAPAIIIAIFSTITVNLGLDSWFSDRIGLVVRNSLETAQAYAVEHRKSIRADALEMANDLNLAAARISSASVFERIVREQAYLRGLPEAYVFDSTGTIIARGAVSHLFSFERPSAGDIERARQGEIIITEDKGNNEIRALLRLTGRFDAFLYVSRRVDGEVLRLLDTTRGTVALYEELESQRGDLLLQFALIYIGFAVLVMMAAMWLGIWFADGLSRPIGKLVTAAGRIGSGDLDARVGKRKVEDELTTLGQAFNSMADRLKEQREELIGRGRFIETVLTEASAGVIALNEKGWRVTLANRSAETLLEQAEGKLVGVNISKIMPQFIPPLQQAARSASGLSETQIAAEIGGIKKQFLLRVAYEANEDGGKYVLTFDDLTALVSAQRLAAWADVARRVAHEIKNPLTPIQLSAEQLKRRYASHFQGDKLEDFKQYLDVIILQVESIRRLTDEFSSFARMPKINTRPDDLTAVLREAILLHSANSDIEFAADVPAEPIIISCDRVAFGQALSNIIKNAIQSIALRQSREKDAPPGQISCSIKLGKSEITLKIIDNGVGLPKENRENLLEPYVTSSESGTGLGLTIVKRIIEQHGGNIRLLDAQSHDSKQKKGAEIVVILPQHVDGQTPTKNRSTEKKYE